MISNYGDVKSVDTKRPMDRKCSKNIKGYLRISLFENGRLRTISLHTLVWDLFGDNDRKGFHVDHIDEDKENNYIGNLQLLSPRENFMKTRKIKRVNYSSQYIGVSLSSGDKKWNARKKIDGVYKSLGWFSSEYDARLAYEKQ